MNKYVVFDSHCDTASDLWSFQKRLDNNDLMVSLAGTENFAGYGQFFAFCTLAGVKMKHTCEELFYEPYRHFIKHLETMQDRVALCRTGRDYAEAIGAGKCAAFLSLEGAEGISCDPGRLDELAEMGIRMVNLTWNADNALAGSSKNDGPGLSAMGKEFVRKAQRLGIIVDVSHISDRAFWDIMEIAEKPVVASHSNSRAVCGHCRNLTDEQFKAICSCGGYTGINLYGIFLSESGVCDFDTVYRHVDHLLELGADHVALGGDLDGCDILPDGFRTVADYDNLACFLEDKGYSHDVIQKIYSKNMEKVVTICTM